MLSKLSAPCKCTYGIIGSTGSEDTLFKVSGNPPGTIEGGQRREKTENPGIITLMSWQGIAFSH